MRFFARCGPASLLGVSLLLIQPAWAAPRDKVEVHAYVNDSCIIADEPFFIPLAPDADPGSAKFLPLLGLVIGKLAELFINHEIQASADRMKNQAARKDTHYAVTKQMNLYRADFQPTPDVSINAKLGCMTIVAATFQPDTVNCTADYVPKELSKDSLSLPQDAWKTSRTDDTAENPLRRANICVAGKARAIYEARFEFSKDGTAYRLKDAGYRIDELLTTDDRNAARTALYTLKISNPGSTDQQETLSSAWVKIGKVSAGSRSSGSVGESAPWLRVPPLSVEARRVYEEKTRVHQEVMGEIDALQRAMARNQRILAGLDQRLATATGAVADGIKLEHTRIAVQNQTQSAELDARETEYHELPHSPLEFMPVTIEVAVTETESEKKAQVALADLIGKNSDMVGSAVGSAASGLISRSLDVDDLKLEGVDGEAPRASLQTARAAYYDALIDVQTLPPANVDTAAKGRLDAAKSAYNRARKSSGLEQIK